MVMRSFPDLCIIVHFYSSSYQYIFPKTRNVWNGEKLLMKDIVIILQIQEKIIRFIYGKYILLTTIKWLFV